MRRTNRGALVVASLMLVIGLAGCSADETPEGQSSATPSASLSVALSPSPSPTATPGPFVPAKLGLLKHSDGDNTIKSRIFNDLNQLGDSWRGAFGSQGFGGAFLESTPLHPKSDVRDLACTMLSQAFDPKAVPMGGACRLAEKQELPAYKHSPFTGVIFVPEAELSKTAMKMRARDRVPNVAAVVSHLYALHVQGEMEARGIKLDANKVLCIAGHNYRRLQPELPTVADMQLMRFAGLPKVSAAQLKQIQRGFGSVKLSGCGIG